jgi:hypothetical protein
MNSIVQKEYIVPKDKFSEYFLLGLSIFLILLIWILILYRSRSYNEYIAGNTSTKTTPGSTSSGSGLTAPQNVTSSTVLEKCPEGECPTNIGTGEKRCPMNNLQSMLFDPTYEVCNPSGACTDTSTPYALLFDQSTSQDGICDVDQCRCVNYLSSASFIQSMFQVNGGSLFESNPQFLGNYYFTQIPNSAIGQGNNIPMRYSDPQTQLWKISPSLLSAMTPKTNECQNAFSKGPEARPRDIVDCINSNPCINGKMAYILGYDQFFTSFDYYNDTSSTSVACVPAIVDNPAPGSTGYNNLKCQDGYAPVFNYITGSIYCIGPGGEL